MKPEMPEAETPKKLQGLTGAERDPHFGWGLSQEAGRRKTAPTPTSSLKGSSGKRKGEKRLLQGRREEACFTGRTPS